jgi:hypothetical protein
VVFIFLSFFLFQVTSTWIWFLTCVHTLRVLFGSQRDRKLPLHHPVALICPEMAHPASCSGRLKLTAKKPPEEDSAGQSGERSKTFTLLTPDWKLAIHALFLSRFPHAGRWLKQKRVSGPWP